MKSIIEQIYYGELSPCSLPTPTCEKYIKARDAIEHIRERIFQKYPDCKDLLEEYTDAIHVTASCEGLQDFATGVRLGVELMIEILDETE